MDQALLRRGLLGGVDHLTTIRHRPVNVIISGYEPYARLCVATGMQFLEQTRKQAMSSKLPFVSATMPLASGIYAYHRKHEIATAPESVTKLTGEYLQDSSFGEAGFAENLYVNTPYDGGSIKTLNQAEDIGFVMTRVVIIEFGGQPGIHDYDPLNPYPEEIVISYSNPWVEYDGVVMRESTARHFRNGTFTWVYPEMFRGLHPITETKYLRRPEAISGILEIETPYGPVPFEEKNLILAGEVMRFRGLELRLNPNRTNPEILRFRDEATDVLYGLYSGAGYVRAYLPAGSMITVVITDAFERLMIHATKPQLNIYSAPYKRVAIEE